MIWEVQVCRTYDFVSSALNNVAILGTREKIIEWIRRLAKVFVWCGQHAWARVCLGAWVRVVLSRSEVSVWSYEMGEFRWASSLNVESFPWWTFILCIKVKTVNRTASQFQTRICYFEKPDITIPDITKPDITIYGASCIECWSLMWQGTISSIFPQYLLASPKRSVGWVQREKTAERRK